MKRSPEEVTALLKDKDESTLATMLMETSVSFLEAGQSDVAASYAHAAATYALAAQVKRIADAAQILSTPVVSMSEPGE